MVGKPNAGKSTLLNRIIGQKLSITSAKPQSTRDRIIGIHTAGDVQMIITDTPGLMNPRYALQHAMRASAAKALADADVIVYVVDAATATDGQVEPLASAADLSGPPRRPVLLAINKVDRLPDSQRTALSQRDPEALFVSALTGDGVSELLSRIAEHLPESPFFYSADDIGTQSVRFFASELVRETALEQLDEEVPYSVACEIEEFREDRTPIYIRAVVYVERDTQKGILIGHRGAQIRDIGRAARLKIENLVGAPVYLDLRVKVLANWRRDARALRRFGYSAPQR